MMSRLKLHGHHDVDDYSISRVVFEAMMLAEEVQHSTFRDSVSGRAAQADKAGWQKWAATFTRRE